MDFNLWVDGKDISYGGERKEVISPLDETVIGSVELYNGRDFSSVIEKIKQAQVEWANLTLKKRAQVVFKLHGLLEENREELAQTIHLENGKTLTESYAAVDKAMELCEFACSLPAVAWGNTEIVSSGIYVKEIKEPVGIVASIVPFNFPLMVPMWTIPTTLVLGNAIIVKPSTETPLTLFKVAELLKEAGLPDGLFTLLSGNRDVVNMLIENPGIDAITFVGSTPVAKIVYKKSGENLKRCLALGGAKNHIIVSPEVDPVVTAREICSAAYGMTGQRCMAASVVVTVGENKELVDEIIKNAMELKVGEEMGPVINAKSRENIRQFLENTKGEILYNGFDSKLPEKGYYVGPSVVKYSDAKDIWEDEVFGPTIEIISVDSIEEALKIQNECDYANGATVFTDLGEVAMECENKLIAGMIGVNIGVPVPRDPFAFGGVKWSKFGHGDITGKSSIEFLTNTKKVTTKWNHADKVDWMS